MRVDAGSTAAVAEVSETVGTDTLSRWAEAADAIGSAAEDGLKALEKYRDGEEVIAANNVDGRTMEPSQS